ncbi:hypothetical protein CVT24_005147 [Panaeolus cyanescens]|uniref:Protein FAM72 n=1 Tax=Panaeolus cyanescens TaxID=181874 RepID=A0A409VDW1_9AGAR|nr:hypothetical protein CVT24_005147 [Panaeolus cyanescens]
MPVSTVEAEMPNHHIFPSNPYPVRQSTTIAHKVWIVDCRACHTFLTNRAMKAVLLLRPSISLFSSDTLPVNCSVYYSQPDTRQHSSSNKASTHEQSPPRTCECLTQTLCCHGCGNTVGYMIVIPCARCTSSISVNNRTTNGHRFVFHSNEVVGTERHYIKGEAGVNPIETSSVVLNDSTAPSIQPSARYSPTHSSSNLPPYSPRSSEATTEQPSPSFTRLDYLPTPPLEFASPAFFTSRNNYPGQDAYTVRILATDMPSWVFRSASSLSPAQLHLPPLSTNASSADPRDTSSTFQTADHKDYPVQSTTLRSGDNVFWHHLTRSGETSGVADDERARFPKTTPFFNR